MVVSVYLPLERAMCDTGKRGGERVFAPRTAMREVLGTAKMSGELADSANLGQMREICNHTAL